MAGKDIIGLVLYKAAIHARPIVFLLVLAGFLGLLALPLLSRRNFFDENALLVGSADTQIRQFASRRHATLASTLGQLHHGLQQGHAVPELLQPHVQLSARPFTTAGHPLQCTNLHTIVPSARGDGSEALAVFTPIAQGCGSATDAHPLCWGAQDAHGAEAALAVGLLLAEYLGQVPWLARDFVWVIPDARCGLVESAEAWMAAQQGTDAAATNGTAFSRAGALQQAVILELHTGAWDSVDVAAIGHDGLLPKLDMFMVAELYTRTEGATRTFLPGAASLPNLLARLGGAAPAAWLQQHYTKVPVALRQYADELARLLGFVGAQALGHAQGAHAACKRFGVDAVTVRTRPRQGGVPVRAALQRVVAAAAAMEGTLRSCNNLLERLHHSYFMYLQPSTTKFTTVEAYVVPPLLLIAALLLWAAHILVAPESGADGQSASVDGPQECPVEEGARLSPGRKLLGMLRRRRAQGPAISGGQQPLLLSVDLAQFERCTSAVLALHAGCAAVGACLHGVDSTASLSPVDLVLSGVSCAGLAAMLLRPWTRPESWASSCPQQTVQGRRQSSGGGAEASQIDDWRAIKALGLVTTAALMAGALFVNWAVAHLSLLCLAVHLLLAHRASQQRADGALAAAPRWVAWLLLHPWGLAALATGHPSVDVGGRVLGLIGPQAWLQWLRSSTVATQAFFWVAYLPAWLLPALVRLAPSPLTSA